MGIYHPLRNTMRSRQQIILGVLALMFIMSPAMGQPSAPTNARSWEELNASFQKEFGMVHTEKYQTPKGTIAAFFPDRGSGVSLISICLYVQTGNGWQLVLERSTNTSRVQVKYDTSSNLLEFTSKAGKDLMTIPADSLIAGFDKSEQ